MYEEQFPTHGGPPAETSPRPFGEVPPLWLKIFHMTEEFFALEAPRARGSNVLISVLILAVVSAVLSAISAGISTLIGGSQMAGLPSEYQETFAASAGGMVVCSLCGGLIGTLLSFYLSNAVVYLGARIFGGSGDFGTQAYLQSLFVVPVGIVTSFLSLVYVIPFVGPCLGGLAMLAVAIYAVVLNVRAVKVAHDLTTGKAVAAIFVPVLVVTVVLACIVIAMLAVLGPAIGNVFSDIVNNLQ